ncbi:hypothetical protein SADUNF_Sadunf05G0042500 [Salix dunnii]|uniref:Uncharacterized protein n=1 Tax=Salix dunnii TaxID=1413687 RepID=A0A835K6Z9_9ROSI|nr:hypothetical protein SADUNF_Sadunf05G0042500 [Salix dunnii]
MPSSKAKNGVCLQHFNCSKLSNIITLDQELELGRYTDCKEGFKVDKAGTTALFEEAKKESNGNGVVVTPFHFHLGVLNLWLTGCLECNLRLRFSINNVDRLLKFDASEWSLKARRLFLWLRDQAMLLCKCMNLNTRLTVLGEGGMKRIFLAAFVSSKKLGVLNITHSDKTGSPLELIPERFWKKCLIDLMQLQLPSNTLLNLHGRALYVEDLYVNLVVLEVSTFKTDSLSE